MYVFILYLSDNIRNFYWGLGKCQEALKNFQEESGKEKSKIYKHRDWTHIRLNSRNEK